MEENNDKYILINILKRVLEKDQDILFAYLYGSHIYGITHLESDVDVAIYLKDSDIKGFVEKEQKLTSGLVNELHTDKIDLRILNISPILLQYEILKNGIPILIRDEKERGDFETRVMNRYFELKPHLDEYQRMLTLRIKAGV